MDLFIARGEGTEGPYSQAEIEERLTDGRLSCEDLVRGKDWEQWMPLKSLIVADSPMTESVGRGRKLNPSASAPTPKQRAYLEFLGVPVPETKSAASEAIEAAHENIDLRGRTQQWPKVRGTLHPDLYPEDIKRVRAQRTEALHGEANSPDGPLKWISKTRVNEVVGYLDQTQPGWDSNLWGEYGWVNPEVFWDAFLPAVGVLYPDLVKRAYRVSAPSPRPVGDEFDSWTSRRLQMKQKFLATIGVIGGICIFVLIAVLISKAF